MRLPAWLVLAGLLAACSPRSTPAPAFDPVGTIVASTLASVERLVDATPCPPGRAGCMESSQVTAAQPGAGAQPDVPIAPSPMHTGDLTGYLLYPGGSTPTLDVVAFHLDSQEWFTVRTNPGAGSYYLTNLPAGDYYVVAYQADGSVGAYANPATHELLKVRVGVGGTSLANLTDWSMPAGSYPAPP